MRISGLSFQLVVFLATQHVLASPSHIVALGKRQDPDMDHDPNPDCRFWYNNDGSFPCDAVTAGFGISLEEFRSWNPSITADCGNFLPGHSYCVEAPRVQKPTTTSKPPTPTGNGIETPAPIQSNMVKNCNRFKFVDNNVDCQSILDEFKISLGDFVRWNPSVGGDCSKLWLGTNACVGVIGGTTSAAPSATTTRASENGIETPLPIQPGMVKNCNKFHPITDKTTCQDVLESNKISLADFFKWNIAVKSDCSNLQRGTNACVGVIGGTTTAPPVTTTKASENGIETPSPIQPGMVKNCNKFHDIKTTTTCANLLSYNKITMESLFKWNPAVKSDCSGLLAGTWACVGTIGGTTTQAPAPTTTKPVNGIETPSPIQSGMIKSCNKFHDIKTTTTCANLLSYNKISMSDLFKWNPAVKSDCSGLLAGTWACVGVIGGTTTTKPPTPTTTKPANGIETPSPIQSGMVKNCNKFHDIKSTTTCANLLSYNKITMADLFKWNPAVKADCSGLLAGTWACVGVIGGKPTTTKPPTQTTTKPANGVKTPSPIQPGMVTNCNKFHDIKSTTTCANLLSYNKITLAELFKWNPGVKSDCSGLQAKTWACVGVIGGSSAPPVATATKGGNGITTPLPIQTGMVKNCKKFHYISGTTTCAALLSYRKITMEQLFKWNPAVKKDCSGLWEGTNACVGV